MFHKKLGVDLHQSPSVHRNIKFKKNLDLLSHSIQAWLTLRCLQLITFNLNLIMRCYHHMAFASNIVASRIANFLYYKIILEMKSHLFLCFLSKIFLKVTHCSNMCPFFLWNRQYLGTFWPVAEERTPLLAVGWCYPQSIAPKELRRFSHRLEKVEGQGSRLISLIL